MIVRRRGRGMREGEEGRERGLGARDGSLNWIFGFLEHDLCMVGVYRGSREKGAWDISLNIILRSRCISTCSCQHGRRSLVGARRSHRDAAAHHAAALLGTLLWTRISSPANQLCARYEAQIVSYLGIHTQPSHRL